MGAVQAAGASLAPDVFVQCLWEKETPAGEAEEGMPSCGWEIGLENPLGWC